MAIGKNAIKRVENNGYSKVQTTAPDMQNSNVIANVSEEVVEKMVKPVEKAVKKQVCTKKNTKKSSKKDGFIRVVLGDSLPYYLL